MPALVTGILTLTPTHPGSGQASAAVDLPIARDPTTGFPILPATALKGVARAALEAIDADFVKKAFGPELGPGSNEVLVAGTLVFGEGQLLLYPLRALHRPVVYATCPLLLQRWDRSLRAFGGPGARAAFYAARDAVRETGAEQGAEAAAAVAPTGALVIEDVALPKSAVRALKEPEKLATYLGSFLPPEEADLAAELKAGLVVLSDELFARVLRRAIPVQTRIRLNDQKTTTGGGGNLWYEEYLPPEVLFGVVIGERSGGAVTALEGRFKRLNLVQVGGNETVGMGRVAWTLKETIP